MGPPVWIDFPFRVATTFSLWRKYLSWLLKFPVLNDEDISVILLNRNLLMLDWIIFKVSDSYSSSLIFFAVIKIHSKISTQLSDFYVEHWSIFVFSQLPNMLTSEFVFLTVLGFPKHLTKSWLFVSELSLSMLLFSFATSIKNSQDLPHPTFPTPSCC